MNSRGSAATKIRSRCGGQRRLQTVPARCLRRGGGRDVSCAPRRARNQRGRLADAGRAARISSNQNGEPDEGIWEVRGAAPAIHALESDGVGGVRSRGQNGREMRLRRGTIISSAGRKCATQIHPRSLRNGYNADKEAFTQAYGSEAMDASILMMPLVGFLPAEGRACARHDRRGRARPDGRRFVLRYRPEENKVDGLPGGEGVFLPCSFWLADCLHLDAAAKKKRASFSNGCSICATMSVLLSEEYDPKAKRLSSEISRRRSPTSAW